MKHNPYVGPRPYERGDRHNFFGRNREARDLLALIMAERTVLFYAQSGAGKTSLINTQIIPSLEAEGFDVLPVARVGNDLPPTIQPDSVDNIFVFSAMLSLADKGVNPQTLVGHTLVNFLATYCQDKDGQPRLPILIFDQFEEIFTTHHEQWQKAEGFFRQVRHALDTLPRLGVVFAMREDYIASIDPYAPLFPQRLRARFRMERLGAEGALEAVRRPAENAGCPFAPGAAEQLVDNLRQIKVQEKYKPREASDLLGPHVEPVQLQVVCNRLWSNLPEQADSRQGAPLQRLIQWEEVEQYGNIDRALTDFYEGALAGVRNQVSPRNLVSERQLRRWVGEQLITPVGTRGLALHGEHDTAGLPNAAVESLEAQHLVRADVRAGARWYELSHDRLVDPILESNKAWEAARQTPLRAAAKRWQDSKSEGLLYRDKVLQEALAWVKANPGEVEPYEIEFLEASQQAQQALTRTRQLRTIATAALAAGLVIMALFAAAMYWSKQQVDTQRQIALTALAVAETQRQEAVTQQAIAQAAQSTAVAEANVRATAQAQAETQQKLARSRELAALALNHVYMDGTEPDYPIPTLAILIAREANRLAHTYESEEVLRLALHTSQLWVDDLGECCPGPVNHLQFSYDSAQVGVAVGSNVRVLDSNDGDVLSYLHGPDDVTYLAFSPDGEQIVTTSQDGTARVWDIRQKNGIEAHVLTGHTAGVVKALFSPDGETILTVGAERTARLWDASTGELLGVLQGHQDDDHPDDITDVMFSPEGDQILMVSSDRLGVWDADSKEQAALDSPAVELRAERSSFLSASFLQDDQRHGRVIAITSDGRVIEWNTTTQEQSTLRETRGHFWRAAISKDGRRIALLSVSGTTLTIQDVLTGQTITPRVSEALVQKIEFSPDGNRLATYGVNAMLWDAQAGKELALLSGVRPSPAGSALEVNIAFSPDSKRVAFFGEAFTYSPVLRAEFIYLQDLMELANMAVPRELTCQERVRYLREELDCPTPTP